MSKLYTAIAGYALLASGCVGPQCLQDCGTRTQTIAQESAACYRILDSHITPNSFEHQEFSRHFKLAAENALGAPINSTSSFFELDPDHFSQHRDAILDLETAAAKKYPWIEHARSIPYETSDHRPPYARRTEYLTLQAIAHTLETTRPPHRKTTLGIIIDTLDDLFGWLFIERPR